MSSFKCQSPTLSRLKRWVCLSLPLVFLQSDSLVVCEVDESLKEKLKKFRFRKETNNAAILSESKPKPQTGCHIPRGLTCCRNLSE